MQADSFRGSCLKCGGPIREGNIHSECAQPDRAPKLAEWRMSAPMGPTQSFGNQSTRSVVSSIPERRKTTVNGVQVCERCGSIGQSRGFVSVNATNMSGASLHMPELISTSQLEKMQEDDADLEFQSNYVLCPNCKIALTSFLHNIPTESGQAGPLAPRLQSGRDSSTTQDMDTPRSQET